MTTRYNYKPGVWHYAVQMGGFYYQAACGLKLSTMAEVIVSLPQGITRLRGDVNCPDCLKAMGLT